MFIVMVFHIIFNLIKVICSTYGAFQGFLPPISLCFCHVGSTNFNMFCIPVNGVSPLEGIVDTLNKSSHQNSAGILHFRE